MTKCPSLAGQGVSAISNTLLYFYDKMSLETRESEINDFWSTIYVQDIIDLSRVKYNK